MCALPPLAQAFDSKSIESTETSLLDNVLAAAGRSCSTEIKSITLKFIFYQIKSKSKNIGQGEVAHMVNFSDMCQE